MAGNLFILAGKIYDMCSAEVPVFTVLNTVVCLLTDSFKMNYKFVYATNVYTNKGFIENVCHKNLVVRL